MLDFSIIIFFVALIGIIFLFYKQGKKLREENRMNEVFHSKDLSYENFKILNDKTKKLWLEFIHSTAIVLSKLWARLTHHIGTWFNKAARKLEQQLIKHEKKNGDKEQTQSVFLTTIKTYKKEIKKLKGKVEEELPRPRTSKDNFQTVDNMSEMDTIEKSSGGVSPEDEAIKPE